MNNNISDESKIWCDKVSCIEDLNTSSKELYLNVYTTKNIKNLTIAASPYIINSRLIYYSTNENQNNYQFCLTFNNQTLKITELLFFNEHERYNLIIGSYELIDVPTSFNKILIETSINENALDIYIHNNLDRTIYLSNIELYKSPNIDVKITNFSQDNACVYQDGVKKMSYIQIKIPENYKTFSGILKIEFMTNLKVYTVYTNYHYNKENDLIVMKSV